MAKNNNISDLLKSVADAIRIKKGTTDLINPQEFDTEILNLSGETDYDRYLAIINKNAAEHKLVFEVDDIMNEVHWQINNVEYNVTNGVGSDASISINGNVVTQMCKTNDSFTCPTNMVGANHIIKVIQLPSSFFSKGMQQGLVNCTEMPPAFYYYTYCRTGQLPIRHFIPFPGVPIPADLVTLTADSIADMRFYNCEVGILMMRSCLASTIRFGEIFLNCRASDTLSFAYARNWTHDSMIESLYTNQLKRDRTSTVTIQLHADARARLSDAEKASIAELGITIA